MLRWSQLCDLYLPVSNQGTVWRCNRPGYPYEPAQGWKLHISATILNACEVFEKVAPVLSECDVQFKAPNSLDELLIINSGTHYGYHQVGKFITVYPRTDDMAVQLAESLHVLTKEYTAISVPFDERYCPGSSVFYRYGGFEKVERIDGKGKTFLAIKTPEGDDIADDRMSVKPTWVPDIFPKSKSTSRSFRETPLGTTYCILRAITQRGKGGTYFAVDLSRPDLRVVIVKEGRRHGEMAWNGHDGRNLAENEYSVLRQLGKTNCDVPQVIDSFELNDNFYFVMEHIEGESLKQLMDRRRRRYTINEIIHFGVNIAKVITQIHDAGWIWNDCKPANLIVTENKKVRPIDFEGSYPINTRDPFDWRTRAFSSTAFNGTEGLFVDTYAFGAVLYFLITGQIFDSEKVVPVSKLRSNVPRDLVTITEDLLSDRLLSLNNVIERFRPLIIG